MEQHRILEGIRVLDLSRVWAGPMATRMLADLGAEVVLIEAPFARGGDPAVFERMRQMYRAGRHFPYYPGGDPGEDPWNRMGMVNDFNRNKLGITLDLRKEAGREVFRRLVRVSDIVLENYSPRVMANFGLDYPALRDVNPAIIMVSLPGYGMSGPYRDYPAYGTTIEQHAGFSAVMGYPDAGPYRTQSTYPDPVTSVSAAGAVLLALLQRRLTGEGQYIEFAQIEAAVCLLPEPLLDYQMNGRPPVRPGNRHPWMAPHGCYRCRGEDAWLSIAIGSDEEWQAFGRAIGSPDWAQDERFATQPGRYHHQDELDRLITAWTAGQDHYQAMHLLQRAGVTAAAVLDARQLLSDPHLRARGYFLEVTHPSAGTHLYPGLPVRFSAAATGSGRPAPRLGQDNYHVLHDLLGLSDREIEGLRAEGVISESPRLP